jgi:hypothetical protein
MTKRGNKLLSQYPNAAQSAAIEVENLKGDMSRKG